MTRRFPTVALQTADMGCRYDLRDAAPDVCVAPTQLPGDHCADVIGRASGICR